MHTDDAFSPHYVLFKCISKYNRGLKTESAPTETFNLEHRGKNKQQSSEFKPDQNKMEQFVVWVHWWKIISTNHLLWSVLFLQSGSWLAWTFSLLLWGSGDVYQVITNHHRALYNVHIVHDRCTVSYTVENVFCIQSFTFKDRINDLFGSCTKVWPSSPRTSHFKILFGRCHD